jgi:hypothetical protein
VCKGLRREMRGDKADKRLIKGLGERIGKEARQVIK